MRYLVSLFLILTLLFPGAIFAQDTITGYVKDWLGNTINSGNGNFSAHVYVLSTGQGGVIATNTPYIASTTSNASTGAYTIDERYDCANGTTICLIHGWRYAVLVLYGGSHTAADGKTKSELVNLTYKVAQ